MIYQVKRLFFVMLIIAASSCHNKTVTQIPINDFFNIQGKNFFHISPDGKYISYEKRSNGKQNIFIQALGDTVGKEIAVTNFDDFGAHDHFWNNNQIIFTRNVRTADKQFTFELDVVDIPGMQMRTLLSTKKANFRVLNRKTADPDVITFAMNLRDSTAFDVYRLNTRNAQTKLYIKNPGNITEWISDADGKIRLAKASDGVNETILYRKNDAASFKPIIVNNFKNKVSPVAFTGEGNYFYARSNVKQDKMALVEINADKVTDEKIIFASSKADLEEVAYVKSKHRLEMIAWEDAKPQKLFLDIRIKDIYADLALKLPGTEIRIADRDTAEKNLVIYAYSDRNPGSSYIYKTATKTLIKLADTNPQINPADLCEMKPISFKARDSMLINGYLTLPLNKSPQNLAVVVIPHSDPWRRNKWGYSPEVQFLANRGYAVFQVNYRGSTGYGKTFFSAGFKQIGGKMQQDIADGVKWLIAQKIANPKKIGIFGSGFGGFTALNSVASNPNLYNCTAVQYSLINMFAYVKDIPPFFKPMLKMRYEMVGDPETDADQFRAISPVFNANKIKVPLLIYQDPNDTHASMSDFNQFVSELKKNGVKVKYLLKESDKNITNNHHKPKDNTKNVFERGKLKMYTELEKFLAENLLDKQ